MCGIVAATGRADAQTFLINGLKRLEYRGYDSAGLAVMDAVGRAARARAAGKVANLEAAPALGALSGETGVAHTRWATHGKPTEANAHPHAAGRVHLVHNGIIENFKTLRAELEAQGRTFQSETDTEVVAHLVDAELVSGADPETAFRRAVGRLEGAFALAAMIDGEPGLVLGARRGAPLLAGHGGGAGYLASDMLALAGEAERVVYLEDGDIAVVRPGAISVTDIHGAPVARPEAPAESWPVRAERGNHRHFMEKEIYEQPEVVGRTIAHYLDALEGAARPEDGLDFASMTRLHIIGCGTAAYAGMTARYAFEQLAGLPVAVDIASEFRYREPAFLDGDAALFISQSGETADTLEAMRLCKAEGVLTIALVNTPGSTMAREADVVLPTLAGPEIGVASTKAFTCQLAALFALAVRAGAERARLDSDAEASTVAELLRAPGLMGEALHLEARVQAMAAEVSRSPIVLYLGRDSHYPLALEGALKLKEISYLHAEGYAAGELKHGPIALIEEGVTVVVIAPMTPLFPKTRSSILEVKSRGATVIALTDPEGARELADEADDLIVLPESGQLAAHFTAAVAIQLLAYHVAVHKGTDVDQPRNLAKAVTVE